MMRNAFGFALMAAVLVLPGQTAFVRADDERTVASRIESVDLFKNGMAVVHRTVELRGAGVHRIEDVPSPVHGTFNVSSERPVVVRLTSRVVEVPVSGHAMFDLGRELAGRPVTVHFRDGVPSITGQVVEQPRPSNEMDGRVRGTPSTRFIVLRTPDGHVYADQSMIAHITVHEDRLVRKEVPVLTFRTEQGADETTTVVVSYLTQGLTWAPQYHMDLSDSRRLRIAQSVMIRNELSDLQDVDVRLITGFPGIEFGHVHSLLARDASMQTFFAQLGQDASRRSGHAVVMQQRVMSNVALPMGHDDPGMAIGPGGDGADVYYHEAGQHDVARGETLAFSVAEGETDYQRIVEWTIPDTRDEWGRRESSGSARRATDEDHNGEVWDAMRFNNPFAFPMTTAPATMVSNGRLLGQQTSHWVNPDEKTTLRINRAFSVRTQATEEEAADAQREPVRLYGRDYRRVPVQGRVSATNHREEAVELVVRRRFSGELTSVQGQPEHTLREEGTWSINKRNELIWTIKIEPGETWTREYRYDVLVRNW